MLQTSLSSVCKETKFGYLIAKVCLEILVLVPFKGTVKFCYKAGVQG